MKFSSSKDKLCSAILLASSDKLWDMWSICKSHLQSLPNADEIESLHSAPWSRSNDRGATVCTCTCGACTWANERPYFKLSEGAIWTCVIIYNLSIVYTHVIHKSMINALDDGLPVARRPFVWLHWLPIYYQSCTFPLIFIVVRKEPMWILHWVMHRWFLQPPDRFPQTEASKRLSAYRMQLHVKSVALNVTNTCNWGGRVYTCNWQRSSWKQNISYSSGLFSVKEIGLA